MLKILVCVKQVPDVDLVTMDPETGNLVREGVPTLTNPLDLNALEAAVQVKERYGGEITLITMGPPMAESTLREGLAVGGDDAILISGRPFGGADTLSTSYPIKMAADMKGKFDLIFCGKESLDGATGQMASQLAERFDASQISCCYSIEEVADGKIKATVKFDSDKTLKFTFDSDCTDGTITAVIVDKESDKTICDFTSGNSTDFEAESGKKYEIIITLDDAKNGSYDLHWENK